MGQLYYYKQMFQDFSFPGLLSGFLNEHQSFITGSKLINQMTGGCNAVDTTPWYWSCYVIMNNVFVDRFVLKQFDKKIVNCHVKVSVCRRFINHSPANLKLSRNLFGPSIKCYSTTCEWSCTKSSKGSVSWNPQYLGFAIIHHLQVADVEAGRGFSGDLSSAQRQAVQRQAD